LETAGHRAGEVIRLGNARAVARAFTSETNWNLQHPTRQLEQEQAKAT
jgi:hypothetical protein